jgi:hypothetical protein
MTTGSRRSRFETTLPLWVLAERVKTLGRATSSLADTFNVHRKPGRRDNRVARRRFERVFPVKETAALMRATLSLYLFLGVAFAQSTAERPAFEVASIRAYPPGAPFPPGGNDFRGLPNGVEWRFARLIFCLAWAYNIPGEVIGPEWIRDRYDIVARAGGRPPKHNSGQRSGPFLKIDSRPRKKGRDGCRADGRKERAQKP